MSKDWWPEYCSKHDGYHLQGPEGGTVWFFKDRHVAEHACEALSVELERLAAKLTGGAETPDTADISPRVAT